MIDSLHQLNLVYNIHLHYIMSKKEQLMKGTTDEEGDK